MKNTYVTPEVEVISVGAANIFAVTRDFALQQQIAVLIDDIEGNIFRQSLSLAAFGQSDFSEVLATIESLFPNLLYPLR